MSGETGSGSAAKGRLLVVDDESHQLEMLGGILKRSGYTVETASGGRQALELLEKDTFDLLLTDQKMPGMDGLALLDQVRARHPTLPVILMTAYGSVSSAVAAMKQGAADYLTKPFERDELLLVLEKAIRQRRLEDEVVALRGALKDRYRLGRIIGSAPAMQEIYSLIERIAHTDVPVLIRGESGTGKELVARAIHGGSARASGPFVALNCAAIPDTLLESECFGHERGAFTGAVRSRAGTFQQADGGTLFMDEIGSMRVDLQAKLLRAIQEKEIQRLGSNSPIPVNARILAATSENLEEAIRQKTFREDLFYRLNVVPIEIPPLRERAEDIPLLVDHFISSVSAKLNRPPVGISPEVLDRLQSHPWLGNVRELENCIERMVLLARGPRLTPADLPADIRKGAHAVEGATGGFELPASGVRLAELERHLIRQALKRSRGSLAPAARLLGISYKTLQYRIRKFGLEREGPSLEDSSGGDAMKRAAARSGADSRAASKPQIGPEHPK